MAVVYGTQMSANGTLPQLRHVLDDADDPEPLAVGLDRLADRRPSAEEALAGGGVDHRDEPRLGDVRRAVRPAFDEREIEDPPELVVRPLQRRCDLPAVDVGVDGAARPE